MMMVFAVGFRGVCPKLEAQVGLGGKPCEVAFFEPVVFFFLHIIDIY